MAYIKPVPKEISTNPLLAPQEQAIMIQYMYLQNNVSLLHPLREMIPLVRERKKIPLNILSECVVLLLITY